MNKRRVARRHHLNVFKFKTGSHAEVSPSPGETSPDIVSASSQPWKVSVFKMSLFDPSAWHNFSAAVRTRFVRAVRQKFLARPYALRHVASLADLPYRGKLPKQGINEEAGRAESENRA